MSHMNTGESVQRGLELLSELLALKSKQDGVPRSALNEFGPKEGYDEFAQEVQEIAMLVMAAGLAIPLMDRLAEVGRSLELKGLIQVGYGDSYADKALDHLLQAAPSA